MGHAWRASPSLLFRSASQGFKNIPMSGAEPTTAGSSVRCFYIIASVTPSSGGGGGGIPNFRHSKPSFAA